MQGNLLRVLVVDDVSLIASCVAARIRSAAQESALSDCQLSSASALTVGGGDGQRRASVLIQEAIFEREINVLVVDRGIAHEMEEKQGRDRDLASKAYYRRHDVEYDVIETILKDVSRAARTRIEAIVVYTLDDPKHGSIWYIDKVAVAADLNEVFPHHPHVAIIKTNSEVYSPTGLKLFNPIPNDPHERDVAHGADLQLYGAIVGEMAWRHISSWVLGKQATHRLELRRWLVRNYFIFAMITFGIGIGIAAAYTLLQATFAPSALLLVGLVVGVAVPFLLLNRQPRLLMLPGIEEE